MADKRLPLLFSGFMFLLAAMLFVYSFLHAPSADTHGSSYGMMFYPRIILSLWGVLAAILFVNTAKAHAVSLKQTDWRSLGSSIAMVALACILLEYAGFLPACIIFCFFYPFALGYKRVAVLLPVSLLYAVALWFLFNKVLLILLPEIPWS